jgi:hypothetical protein
LDINNADDYLEAATSQVRAAFALRDDLLAVLFPRGETAPSELLQTQVKLKVLALVNSIERRLLGTADSTTHSWDMLAKAGLLREVSLIQFALARIAEDQITRNIQAAGDAMILSQLPTRLLAHDNEHLAEMARKLINAEQRVRQSDAQLYHGLDSENLHLLAWRVVAALQQHSRDKEKLVNKANALLSEHDGTQNPFAIARKLVFFLGSEHNKSLIDPRKAGLSLFVAALAQNYGLDSDLLLRLIGETSAGPLLLMLKGNGVAVEQLPAILSVLRGSAQADTSPDLGSIYSMIDPINARATVAGWADSVEAV